MIQQIKILKWTLIAFNIAYFSAGYHMLYEDWSVDQTVYQTPSIGVFLNLPIRLTYALGSLIILTSLLGIFAAYRENSLLLKFYAILVLTSIVSQVGIHYLFFKRMPEVTKQLSKEILIERYDLKTREDRNKIQEIQQAHSCCGVFGPSDYNNTFIKLPNSCCGRYKPVNDKPDESRYHGGLFDPQISKDAFLNHGDCSNDEVKNVKGCGNLFAAELYKHKSFMLNYVYLFFWISYGAQLPCLVLALVLSHKIVKQFMV